MQPLAAKFRSLSFATMVLGIGGGGKKKKEEEEAAAASAREAELAAVAEAATRSKPDTLR